MVEWDVWCTDGRRYDSRACAWAEVPHGVLVVRAWFPGGAMTVNWGDGLYGEPGTWKEAGWVSDETFARVLADAQATSIPPSGRT
jgi:hypothetical protein